MWSADTVSLIRSPRSGGEKARAREHCAGRWSCWARAYHRNPGPFVWFATRQWTPITSPAKAKNGVRAHRSGFEVRAQASREGFLIRQGGDGCILDAHARQIANRDLGFIGPARVSARG